MSVEAEGLEQLVRRAHSSDAAVRDAALKQLLELPDEALLQLLARYDLPSRSHSSRLMRRLTSSLLYLAFAIAIGFALSKDPSADPRLRGIIMLLSGGLLVALLFVLGRYLYSLYSVGRPVSEKESAHTLPLSLVLLLAGRTDSRFLPYLLSEMNANFTLFERTRMESDRHSSVYPGLGGLSASHPPDLLPQSLRRAIPQARRRYRKLLKAMLAPAEGAELPALSEEQRRALLLPLQLPEEDVDLTIDILAYLEHSGDARAMPALKSLIKEDHWYVGSERVEAAARRCLESIENRMQHRRQGETLLRPTHAADSEPPQTLLRPTVERPEQTPEQLLRPGNNASSEHQE